MNFYEMVNWAIIFCCLVLSFYVLRIFAIPFDIGYPSLDPKPITIRSWLYFNGFLLAVLVAIIVFVIIMYVIYRILKAIPLIGSALVSGTPFRELNSSGLFGLCDAFVRILSSGFSFESIMDFGKEFIRFLYNSFNFIRNAVANGDILRQPRNPSGDDLNSRYGTPDEPRQDEANVLTEAERFQIRDEYVKCTHEKMSVAKEGDSKLKRQLLDVQNQGTRMQCHVQSMGTYIDILMSHRKFFAD